MNGGIWPVIYDTYLQPGDVTDPDGQRADKRWVQVFTALAAEVLSAGTVLGFMANGSVRAWQVGDIVAGVVPLVPELRGGSFLPGHSVPVVVRGRIVARLASGAARTIKARGRAYVLPNGYVTGDATAGVLIPTSEALVVTTSPGSSWYADGVLIAVNLF